MTDNVFREFLEREQAAGLALAAASDILTLIPLKPFPAQRYVAEFRCRGLVHEQGTVQTCDRFLVGIAFPDDHLRRKESRAMVSLIAPETIFHPNARFPVLCPGMMPAGTGLVDLAHQIFEILVFERVGLKDPLNEAACRWARSHMDLFPLDPRPLKRRTGNRAAIDTSGDRTERRPATGRPRESGPTQAAESERQRTQ